MDLVACGTCGRNFNADALTRHAPICKKNAKKKPRKQFDSQKNRLVGTEVNITDLKRKEKKGLSAKEQRAADRKNNWKAKHEELIRNIRAARGEPDQPTEPSYDHRSIRGGGGGGSSSNGRGGYGSGPSYGSSHGSYGNDYSASSSKPSNGYNSNNYNSYNNNNYGYNDSSPPARSGYSNGGGGGGGGASRIPGPKAVPPGYMNCAHCGRNFAEETAERHIPWCAEQQKRKAMKQGNPETKQTAAQKMAARTQYKPPKPTGKRTSTSGGSSGYGQASSGYGPGGSYTQGYAQQKQHNSNSYFDDDLLGNQQQRLVAPSAGRRAVNKQSVLTNLNRDRSAGTTRTRQLRKNCGKCSTIYPVDWAKYCCECGAKRT